MEKHTFYSWHTECFGLTLLAGTWSNGTWQYQLFPRIIWVSCFSVVLVRGPFLNSGGPWHAPPRPCPALLDPKPPPAAWWSPTLSILHVLWVNTLECRSTPVLRTAMPSAACHVTQQSVQAGNNIGFWRPICNKGTKLRKAKDTDVLY